MVSFSAAWKPSKPRKRRKTRPRRPAVPKGSYPIKSILDKAIVCSKVQYRIDWDLPKGTKRNWIDYINLAQSVPTLKPFDFHFNNDQVKYANFVQKSVSKINPTEVAEHRKYLEDNELVARIVAYEIRSQQVIIFWENGCISPVDLTLLKDVTLKRAIGAQLVNENKWALEFKLDQHFGKNPYPLPPDTEEPDVEQFEDGDIKVSPEGYSYELYNYQHYYEGLCDSFGKNLSPDWIRPRAGCRSRYQIISNPTFPASDVESLKNHPDCVVVNHTMCTNCGLIWESPGLELIRHILQTGHIGWYVGCLLKKNEAAALNESLSGLLPSGGAGRGGAGTRNATTPKMMSAPTPKIAATKAKSSHPPPSGSPSVISSPSDSLDHNAVVNIKTEPEF